MAARMRPGPRNVSRRGDTRDGERSRMLRCRQDRFFGFEGTSCRQAKASRSPLCVAAETAWGPFRLSSAGERVGVGDAVLMVTLVTFSPMERAASISVFSASRRRACHSGDWTRKTRCSPSTLASRHWPASVGGRWPRRVRSSSSSQRARRNGLPDLLDITASSARTGAVAGRGSDFGSDIRSTQ